jgi:hypothetical protein
LLFIECRYNQESPSGKERAMFDKFPPDSWIVVILLSLSCLTSCGGGGGANSSAGGINLGGAVSVDTTLSFQTQGQNLFQANGLSAMTKQVNFDLINQQIGPVTRGKIVNTQVPLTVAQLQAIWQKAMNICTGTAIPIIPGVLTIYPTATQCETGTIQYCLVPPMLGWGSCPDPFGGNRQTYYVGGSIGPKPTQPTTRAYDIGMLVTSSADLRMGLQGTMTRDFGSVDVSYSSFASLAADKDHAAAGDVVTLMTGYLPRNPHVMTSRYPNFRLALDLNSYFTANVSTEYAGVNQTTGDPVRKTTPLYSVDSRTNPNTTGGVMLFSGGPQSLFDMQLNSGGLTVTVAGAPIYATGNTWNYEVTWPLNGPKAAKIAPKLTWPVSFSLADFTLSVPRLDTPAPSNYDCGMCTSPGGTPPLRNYLDTAGTITNTTPLGTRTLIGGITDGNGLTLPLVNDGHEDADMVRLDLDADAATLAVDAPLGAIFSDPLGLFTAELNLLDLDLANFLSVDQRLNFDPNLQVELQFSVPTEVKGPADTGFSLVSTKLINVGDSVQYLQPASDLSITPVYTLRNNHFVNDTKLKITTAIQETLDQAKFTGVIPDLASSLLGTDLNFALLQLTPQLYSPQVVDASDTTPWTLAGFSDVTGSPLSIKLQ